MWLYQAVNSADSAMKGKKHSWILTRTVTQYIIYCPVLFYLFFVAVVHTQKKNAFSVVFGIFVSL